MNKTERIRKLVLFHAVQIITPELDKELKTWRESSPKNEMRFQEIMDRMTKAAIHWRDPMTKDAEELL